MLSIGTSLKSYSLVKGQPFTLRKKAFENSMEKRENNNNHHFLLFQECLQTSSKQIPTQLCPLPMLTDHMDRSEILSLTDFQLTLY